MNLRRSHDLVKRCDSKFDGFFQVFEAGVFGRLDRNGIEIELDRSGVRLIDEIPLSCAIFCYGLAVDNHLMMDLTFLHFRKSGFAEALLNVGNVLPHSLYPTHPHLGENEGERMFPELERWLGELQGAREFT